jgi:ATP-dependent Lhr-like helicase
VAGFSGEQFALPEAVDALRSVRKMKLTGERIRISAADPLNVAGIVLPGPRVPALPANSVSYVDGMVAANGQAAAPVLSA